MYEVFKERLESLDNSREEFTRVKAELKGSFDDENYDKDIEEEFNWNKHELVYNLKDNTWYKINEINFEAPCGHALLSTDTHIYSIMGEIKPAVRSPHIHQTKK